MNTRIVSLLVAGFVGILIGWLLGPNIDEVREDVTARLDAQLPQIAALQNGIAGIEQRLAAAPSPDAAVATLGQRLDALQASVAAQTDAVATRVQEQAGAAQEQARVGIEGAAGAVQQRFDAIEAQIRELTAGLQERAAAPVETGSDAAALASEIGAAGAVLLPGQGAIFGGGRLDLVSLDEDAGTATLRPEGGEETTVEGEATVALSPTCTVRLAGVAAGAAYLMAEACEESAAPAAASAPIPAPASPEADAAAPVAAPAAAPTNEAPAGEPAAQDAERGSDVPAQGAQAVPNQQPGMASGNAGAQSQMDRPAAATDAAPAQ